MFNSAFLITGYPHIYEPYSDLIPSFLLLAVGGILPLVESNFLAQIQNSVGPETVGFNGRSQFIADAVKVLVKNTSETWAATGDGYTLFFNIYISIGLTLGGYIIWGEQMCMYEAYVLLGVYMLGFSLSNLCLAAIGVTSGNRYTALASSSCANMMFMAELLLSILVGFFFFLAASVDVELTGVATYHTFFLSTLIVIFPIFFQALLAETGSAPYDLVEAESEMVMGYSSEHSGFFFAGFVLVEYLYVYVMLGLLPLILPCLSYLIGLLFFFYYLGLLHRLSSSGVAYFKVYALLFTPLYRLGLHVSSNILI